jgi:hypothetical protein
MSESASTALLPNADLLATTAGIWRLDPSSSSIEIHTKAIWGLAKVKGTFNAVRRHGDRQRSRRRLRRAHR